MVVGLRAEFIREQLPPFPMKNLGYFSIPAVLLAAGVCALACSSSSAADQPYKILNTAQFPGSGGIDYVYADSDGRRLYVPRGGEVLVFDLDTLKAAGTIANTRARGAVVDPKSHHGFASSSPVVMWDTQTLATIKTIDVQGRPDGLLFEPGTQRVFIFSHTAPNATVLDAKDGSIVGTIDLGGAPEQAASDGQGHLYVDIEDKDNVAVVDTATLKVTAHYGFEGKGGTPAGLALDAKNHILFAFCRNPQTCVVLSATDGKILATLPIGRGTDGGGFNPHTMEAFSSNGDGTLTIIKENSPTDFVVTQNVTTKARAKTSTLDTKLDRIVLITTEPMPGTAEATAPKEPAPAPGTKKGGGNNGPAYLDLIVVGR
jgi:DNA-binding beta-propeller fold protein YncE